MFDDPEAAPWLDGLNAEQREAATYAGGTLLILAGAGTGKTTTLCARVAWLLGEGVPAERILLLTFTRRAAREMVERARTLAERVAPHAGAVVGGTFHSVAHRMVRMHASSLGLAARLRRARRGRRGRPARLRARGAGPCAQRRGASRARRRCSTSTRAPSTRRRRWRRCWRSPFRGARSIARRSLRSFAPTGRASARSA